MKLKSNAVEWAMRFKAFPLSLAAVLFLVGIYALFNMPRNEFPEFTVRQGLVIGYYPGASSQQVEEQLTKKVEEYLFSFNEVNKAKTYSYSRDGMMYVFVEVANNVNSGDTKAFWNKLKNGVLLLKAQLPQEVKGIMVNSDYGNTSAILLAVESPSRSYKGLQKNVEDIEDGLREIEDLARITRVGSLNEQISIYVDNNKLINYGITSGYLMQALQKEGAISPTGTLEGDAADRPIHLTSFFKTETDLANQIIKTDKDGNVVRLRDISTITREYDSPDSYVTANGTKCIVISMEMTAGKNIVHFGEKVDKKLAELGPRLPADIKLSKLANQPEVVNESIGHFMKEFGFALIGVIIVAVFLLPFRVAAVAAATIPITIAATLALMYTFGLELNTVTLAALIIVLGIVVDDPIVVIDNHIEKLDHGMSVWDAAKESARELFPSVFTATLAIAATFTPLIFFMSGIAADFIKVFPFTIIIALTLSLVISMLLVPYFNTLFIKKGLQHGNKKTDKKSLLDRIQKVFNKQVRNAIDHYVITIGLGVLSIIAGGFFMSKLPQQLFPKVERNQFAMEIYLPNGQRLEQTDSIVKHMERIMANDKRITNYTSFIGTSSPRFHTVYAPQLPAKNYAQILINTTTEKTTEEILSEYAEKYGNAFPMAYVRLKQLNMISAPAPIEVRISGNDLTVLKRTADTVKRIAEKQPGIVWVRTDYEQPQHAIHLDINNEEASRLGVTKEDISNVVAMNMQGLKATQVWENGYAVDVKVKTDKKVRTSTEELLDLSVPVQTSRTIVPLRQVADLKAEWQDGQIVRRNGVRTLTVRMDVKQGEVATSLLNKFKGQVEAIQLPAGTHIGYGGELEMQKENEGPMAGSLLISIIVIFLILVWHFKHVKYALLSITTMPLSVLGAGLGLMLMRYPFGFTSFIGLLALCGIVVRNGIILIDFAEELRQNEGYSVKDAARIAAERRMRPIFLTSTAAAVGVIPMIISRSSLWGPLGTVICFGLLVSMVLTLFVLPALYWLFFHKEEQKRNAAEAVH
ncbi:efflux RND transporter permease subunit [Filimonas effusa]|uniref:Efflux RND transporter permease subunit n=1 Tax=Filimonas effusa TaxID=2508721 RepID=A0A4Q1DAY4_9BACT|nr:efflux RND transporter permease subunit [Filimonas effusa]RXK86068.1 efflux RND transporter permease subunit [Filimonas effusa]